MFLVRSLAAAVSLALALLPATSRAAELPAAADQPSAAEAAIRRVLDHPLAESLPPLRLVDLVAYLKDQYRIEVQLDGKAMSEGTARSADMVTLDMEGVRLRTALELALRPLDLTWTIYDGVLLITTPDEADNLLVARVYNVEDLVRRGDPRNDDYEALIELITSTIEPTSWDEVGGPGSIQEFRRANRPAIVVSQTPRAQEEIAALFAALRQVGGNALNDGSGPRVAGQRSSAVSRPRREPSPPVRQRTRAYQAAAWMSPRLHQ